MTKEIEGTKLNSIELRESLLTVSTPTPRTAMMFYFAVLIQLTASAIAGVGFSLNRISFWMAGSAIWVLWFGLMFAIFSGRVATLPAINGRWLKHGALSIFITLIVLGTAEGMVFAFVMPAYLRSGSNTDFASLMSAMQAGFQYNDGTALSQQAAENFLNGKNPYAHANIIEALTKYHGSFDRVTPLRVGQFKNVFPYPTDAQLKQLWDTAVTNPAQPPPELESQVCYPAGSFLLPAPFIAAGIKDIRIVYAIFVFAGLVYAAWKIPAKNRLFFIGGVLISLELWNSIADGETGSMVFPLLLIAWISMRKNFWLSTIFMGLAVTTKQTAWFLLPFYLVLLWRTMGMKKLLEAAGIIAGIFVVTNVYFAIRDPSLWVSSVASPMVEPMFPIGVGIVTLVTSGIVHLHASLPFTVLEGTIFVAAILWYLRYCRRYPHLGPLLAILPIFFAWRSLWSYFFYVAIISFAALLIEAKTTQDSEAIRVN